MMKKLYLLRRYIVAAALLLYLGVAFIGALFNSNSWNALFASPVKVIVNLVVCGIIVSFVYGYIEDKLIYEVYVDDESRPVEVKNLLYDSFFYGSILLAIAVAVVIGADYFVGKKISLNAVILACVFLAAPFFWIKLGYSILMYGLRLFLSFFVSVSEYKTIIDKDERGDLSVMEALMRMEYVKTVNEILLQDNTVEISTDDTTPFTRKLARHIVTNGKTQEIINAIENTNHRSFNKAATAGGFLAVFMIVASLGITVQSLEDRVTSINSANMSPVYNDVQNKVSQSPITKNLEVKASNDSETVAEETSEVANKMDNSSKLEDKKYIDPKESISSSSDLAISKEKYKTFDYTGADVLLKRGTKALISNNVNIQCYNPSFNRSFDVNVNGKSQEERIVWIKNFRTIDYGGQALLNKSMKFYDENKNIVLLKKGIEIQVNMNTGEDYECDVEQNGKAYGVFLTDNQFTPVKPHYWYLVSESAKGLKFPGWIEGKYLSPIRD